MRRQLVIFDFDGTLSRADTMLAFTRFCRGNIRFFLGMACLLPVLLCYKAGWIPNWRAKELFLTHFFRGEPLVEFQEACRRFGRDRIPGLIRPEALRQLEKHRSEGGQVVVVSASAEDWLAPWCRHMQVDLLATRLQARQGRLTGKLDGPNCFGPEKVNRLKAAYRLHEYAEIIAYGDSKGDAQLFEIASSFYYKPFRGQR